MKQAIMFPGLGADYPDMVATFCQHHPETTNAVELTIERGLQLATAFGLKDVKARKFLHTQLSIHALNLAWFSLQKNLLPHAACGHSLGFYAAAVTANAISAEDALSILVAAFTRAWHQFSNTNKKVAVLTGFVPLLETPLTNYTIEVLSVNNPTQWLLYGAHSEFDAYLERAGDQVMRIDYFATALPFHSTEMKDICKTMEQEFCAMEFCAPRWPLISHIGKAELITTAEQVRWHLLNQLRLPIDWPQLVTQLKTLELDPILELGPNRILTQMIRWVDKRVKAKCVDIYRVKETTHAVVNSSTNTTAKVALA
jgi:[acyl-carrier-protein] S-malonyltransferase